MLSRCGPDAYDPPIRTASCDSDLGETAVFDGISGKPDALALWLVAKKAQRLLESCKDVRNRKTATDADHQLVRFKLWASNIGIFAIRHASLDYRLRTDDLVKTSIWNDLEVLSRRVAPSIETTKEAMTSIEWSISELLELSQSIRRTSNRDPLTTVPALMDHDKGYSSLPEGPNSTFEKRISSIDFDISDTFQSSVRQILDLRWLVSMGKVVLDDQFKGYREELIGRCVELICIKRRQLLYDHIHQHTLRLAFEEQQNYGSSVATSPIPSMHPLATAPLEKETADCSAIQQEEKTDHTFGGGGDILESKTYRPWVLGGDQESEPILSGCFTFPEAPKSDSGPEEKTCIFCHLTAPATSLTGQAWRDHLAEDLQPYFCLHQFCRHPYKTFSKFHEWEAHLNLPHTTKSQDQDTPLASHPEMIASTPSHASLPQRCFVCLRVEYSDMTLLSHMQRHLETVFLLALPIVESNMPSGTMSSAKRGRSQTHPALCSISLTSFGPEYVTGELLNISDVASDSRDLDTDVARWEAASIDQWIRSIDEYSDSENTKPHPLSGKHVPRTSVFPLLATQSNSSSSAVITQTSKPRSRQRRRTKSMGRRRVSSRQNTDSTCSRAGSCESWASHRSYESYRRLKIKPRVEQRASPVSIRSLPEFRRDPPVLHWPAAGERVGAPIIAAQMSQSPDGEFRRHLHFQGQSNKSTVWSVVVKTSDGRDERLALKVVPCNLAPDSAEFRSSIQHEYKLLAKINHNHIIAVVGSYVDGDPGNWNYGLLLFPLAQYDLEKILNSVSLHNSEKSGKHEWTRHGQVNDLLDYLACLCRAIIYLHTLEQPIRHRDVKPANILVDAHGTVMLADFDIAKRYPNKSSAHTDGATSFTDRYATQAVRDGAERSFEWDVYSLGCVALEVATVVMGETMENLRYHMAGGTPDDLDYHQALQVGRVDSWIQQLKLNATKDPERAPLGRFGMASPGAPSSSLDSFLSNIVAMMRVNINNHPAVLQNAWLCFSKVASKDCEHCYPEVRNTLMTMTHFAYIKRSPARRLCSQMV